VRLSNSQDVSLIERVLNTLVLRLITNDGLSFDSVNRMFRIVPVSWVRSSGPNLKPGTVCVCSMNGLRKGIHEKYLAPTVSGF